MVWFIYWGEMQKFVATNTTSLTSKRVFFAHSEKHHRSYSSGAGQPPLPPLCILVYVYGSDGRWRSLDCFEIQRATASAAADEKETTADPLATTAKYRRSISNRTSSSAAHITTFVIPEMRPAERLKARFCMRRDLSVCSTPYEIHGKWDLLLRNGFERAQFETHNLWFG